MVNETLLNMIYEAVKDQPASKPPPGIRSNLIDPPNYHKLLLGYQTTCIAITTIMVFSQMYVKIFIVRKMHIEDWVLPVAYLFELVHTIPAFHAANYDPLLHQWDIPVRNILKVLLDVHIGSIAYDTVIILLKICILSQFLRIFVPQGNRSAKWTTYVLIWTNTVFFLTCVFIRIFACKPMRKQWNPLILEGHCLNIRLQQMFPAGFNTGFDLLILAWTHWIIWRLHMSWTTKLRLAALFSWGLGACLGAALRFYAVIQLLQHHNDQVYYVGWMAFWSYLETTSAFLVICLPMMPKLVVFLLRRVDLLSNGSRISLARIAVNHPHAKIGSPQRSWWHISGDSNSTAGDTRALTLVGTTYGSGYEETDETVEIKREDSGLTSKDDKQMT